MSIFDQYAVIGDNDSDGDSVYLHCRRCKPEGEHVTEDMLRVGSSIARFQTNHWDDEPTVCTLQDLFRTAREHDARYHSGFTPPAADTGEINVIRGRE